MQGTQVKRAMHDRSNRFILTSCCLPCPAALLSFSGGIAAPPRPRRRELQSIVVPPVTNFILTQSN